MASSSSSSSTTVSSLAPAIIHSASASKTPEGPSSQPVSSNSPDVSVCKSLSSVTLHKSMHGINRSV